MELKDICRQCIWYDQCAGDEECDFSSSEIMNNTYLEDEYWDDLEMRQRVYQEYIEEEL